MMIVQNNSSSWVALALLVMTGCVVAGMILGNVGPFNTEATATKAHIMQTQQAALSTQVAAVKDIPIQENTQPYQRTLILLIITFILGMIVGVAITRPRL